VNWSRSSERGMIHERLIKMYLVTKRPANQANVRRAVGEMKCGIRKINESKFTFPGLASLFGYDRRKWLFQAGALIPM
jgi:hypothetical protein